MTDTFDDELKKLFADMKAWQDRREAIRKDPASAWPDEIARLLREADEWADRYPADAFVNDVADMGQLTRAYLEVVGQQVKWPDSLTNVERSLVEVVGRVVRRWYNELGRKHQLPS